jgi:hypothetical protein
MLHKIKPGAERELRKVMAFQREVLAFACDPSIHTQCDSNNRTRLDKTEILARFPQTGKWLWSHSSLHDPIIKLNKVVRANPALAQQILDAYDNDASFDQRTTDPQFRFQCCGLPNPISEEFVRLMQTFYMLLGRDGGFSVEIAGAAGINRTGVVRRFWTGNGELNVCPACDGPRPRRSGQRDRSQCDHFFPESKHAALSIHPLNLVPVCGECNYDKLHRDANDYALLSEMFAPYIREAFGPLTVEVYSGKGALLELTLKDGGDTNTPRLRALNHVTQLTEVWTDRLRNRVSGSIVDNLSQQKALIARLNGDRDELLFQITAHRTGARNKRGKEQDAILKEAYFAFLEATPSARSAIP